MKAIVLQFILVLACSMQVSAQSGHKTTNTNIISDGTHFVQPVTDKKWNNSNGKDFTKASFVDFSGSCYVFIEVKETATVRFHSFTEVNKGKVEIKLIDEEETVYFYCDITEVCLVEKDIVLEKGKKYRLYFTGENAKGNYLVKWK